jgi:DNA-binding NarL/FixJ family response regulator
MLISKVDDSSTHIDKGCSLDRRAARPRIFILSDCRILCEGLVISLARQSSIMLIGASSVPISPAEIAELHPDVLVLDIATADGLDTSVSLRQLLPDMRTVAIGVAEVEDEVIAGAKAGVAGFVSRRGSVQDIATAVHRVMRGEFVCPPRVASLLFTHVGAMPATRSDISGTESKLTQRELEIVSLVGDGLSNKEIARVLGIQIATVKNHIHSILAKTRMRRRAEIAAGFRRAAPTIPNSVGLGSLQIR